MGKPVIEENTGLIIADGAARHAAAFLGAPEDWEEAWAAAAGEGFEQDEKAALHYDPDRGSDQLCRFVRENREAPVEALYRFASAQEIHRCPPDAWDAQPFWFRAAYEIFRSTLLAMDAAMAAERVRLAELERQAEAGAGLVLAAALSAGGDMEGTALELQPDPLATREGMAVGPTEAPASAEEPPAAEAPTPAEPPAEEPPASADTKKRKR